MEMMLLPLEAVDSEKYKENKHSMQFFAIANIL